MSLFHSLQARRASAREGTDVMDTGSYDWLPKTAKGR